MRCVEIWAGMGGMAVGLHDAGFEHSLLVECDAACVDTLRRNGFAPDATLCARVEEVDFRPFRGVDLVAGGVPCQPFSAGGNHLGCDDPRDLWGQAIRVVAECAPRAFFFENAATMLSPTHAPYLQQIVARFEAMGYAVWKHRVDAVDYGCPQRRKRLLLIGVLAPWSAAYVGPAPTAPGATVRELLRATATLPDVVPREGYRVARTYRNHSPSALDGPAKAVVAGARGCPGGANAVTMDDGTMRHFSPREMACIQTFPPSYALPSVWTTAVRQIGNAAPPALVATFARAVGAALVANHVTKRRRKRQT